MPKALQGKGAVCFPIKVLERRTSQQQGEPVQHVLIEWQERAPKAATWEDEVYKINFQILTLRTWLFRPLFKPRQVMIGP